MERSKGHECADGRKQRAYITKEESTAPMVSTEAVFLNAIIDAMEGRNVVVLDVPGALMRLMSWYTCTSQEQW